MKSKFIYNKSAANLSHTEHDAYKKLWNFFLLGDSYYFIINYELLVIEHVSQELEDVLGYHPSEFTLPFMSAQIHPEDYSWFVLFGSKMIEFYSQLPIKKWKQYKVRYDLRYRKKSGDYARLLYHGLILEHDDQGFILKTLNVHTDITYLKQEHQPRLSFIGMNGEPSFINVGLENIFIENEKLTKREKQVLTLLVEGKLSKEISCILNISKQTVDTHRKNMLHKKCIGNTSELIGKAIKNGWI
jgi:DNA-binding CsgD family transcriptional regulator